VIEQALRALDGMCLNLKCGNDIPPKSLFQLIDFFQNFADRFHHAKEEAYLFPALCHILFENDKGAIKSLIQEHEIERALVAELEKAIKEYSGGDSTAATRFVESAYMYRDRLIGLMREEESFLFRLAESALDESVKSSLIHSFAGKAPADNDGMVDKYEEMAEELEKNWAI